ncbi:MAG: hypothetical protein RBR77_12875 [Thauera sp.]|jgi:hypothetical protein|nr:hypothetical protein [Thauera sp.]
MPAAKPRPGTLRNGQALDLGELLGSEWENFALTTDGLQHPCWRNPFSCADLKAMFWQCQQVAILEHEIRQLKKEITKNETARELAEQQANWYRRQLILESRMGFLYLADR